MTTKPMKSRASLLHGSALLLTVSLAGCGGGGGESGSPPMATPQETGSVPDSAFLSTDAFLTFQRTLSVSDRSEPLEIGNLTPPVDDRAEPIEIG